MEHTPSTLSKFPVKSERFALIVGAFTLIMFVSRPYILDLIEPAKSIGAIIGENAMDLMNRLDDKDGVKRMNSKRTTWSSILTIVSFVLFAISMVLSIQVFQQGDNKWLAIGAATLAIIGLIIFFAQLAISFVGMIVIAILVVVLVVVLGNA